jgi:hypothetical protein
MSKDPLMLILYAIVVPCAVGLVVAIVMFFLTVQPLTEKDCIRGADPPIQLAVCERVQP